MVTNQAPQDYQKKIVLVSQLVNVCAICGEYTCISPKTGQRVCMTCDSTETIKMWEHEVPAFREERAACLTAFVAITSRPEYNA